MDDITKEFLVESYENLDSDLVSLVEELPPMPDALTKAVHLTDDPNSEPSDLAKIILQEPSLATPILRVANSAAFGQQREVTSLSTAILLVGMRQIKNMPTPHTKNNTSQYTFHSRMRIAR